MKRRWIALFAMLIPVTLGLQSCSKKEGSAPMATREQATDAAPAPAAPAVDDAKLAGRANAAAPAVQRMIIRTANIELVVADPVAAAHALSLFCEARGGWVATSKQWREGEQPRASLTLRVPAKDLAVALAEARRLAIRVESETVEGQDVSEEFADLGSQLRNLEAAENELRELLVTVRQNAKRASDILEVYQQLVTIRGQIEATRGRMNYLSQMAAMSTIHAELMTDALATPVVEPGWRPLVIARDAGRSLVRTLQAFASALIWIVVYLLPIALLIASPLIVIILIVRRRRKAVKEG
ncbi:MAG: DUF4349 domain-containing protein [Acidobacteria bacterium]|nr:DUF4349 domain-containing protein [Acidobacteriota bacterium]